MQLLLMGDGQKMALRFDETEVSVLSFIKHAYAAGVRIAKDDKTIGSVREFEGGLFRRHRLYVIAAGVNDPHRQRGRLQLFVRICGGHGCFRRTMLPVNDLFLELVSL